MNILALTSAYPEPDDGTEVVTPTVKYFCEKWAEGGDKVIVIHSNSKFPGIFYSIPESIRGKMSSQLGHNFPTKASRKPITYKNHGINVYRLPMFKIIPYIRFSRKVIRKQVKMIEEILQKEAFKPDIIISHWVNPQVYLVAELKKSYKIKTSLVFHGDCHPKQIKQHNLKETIKIFDAVGCRNEGYAEYVKNALGLEKRPFICYSGVPDELANFQMAHIEDTINKEQREFIYVGRLVQYKNVDTIIKALKQKYPAKNFLLHIIGVGAEKENLEKLVGEIGLQNNVIFHGQLPRKEVFDMMKKSSCFIMVSNNETFGMVYIEAMLAGCVTIASIGGGVDGVLLDGFNGYLSKQGDVEELVNTLTRIDNTSFEEIQKLRRNAVITAHSYSDTEVAKRYINDVMNWK